MSMYDEKAKKDYKSIVRGMAILLAISLVVIVLGSFLAYDFVLNVDKDLKENTNPGLDKLAILSDGDPQINAGMLSFMTFTFTMGGIYWLIITFLAIVGAWGLIVYTDRMPRWWREPMQRRLEQMELAMHSKEILKEDGQHADRQG